MSIPRLLSMLAPFGSAALRLELAAARHQLGLEVQRHRALRDAWTGLLAENLTLRAEVEALKWSRHVQQAR